ncbi:MAG: aldo/keto reductase [Chloroflexota bacterium]|nr:aldo/keto reductase [Chloroflexota bacterium]
MEYRRLGRTNLDVSLLGLGSGGPSQLGQRSGVPESDIHTLVDTALGLGVNLIDTAAAYNESEAILGRALKGKPRDSYVLCTKSSPAMRDGAETRPRTEAELVESLEASLRRLGTDVIDVFQIHAVTPDTYAHTRDALVPELLRQRDRGKIRFIGITEAFASDHERATLRSALADDCWDTILVGYNLLTPGPGDDVLPLAQANDVGVLVMCAVRRKIANPADLAALVASLKRDGLIEPDALPDDAPLDWLLHDGIESVTDAAYTYVAANPLVHSVLTGTASVDHLRQNVDAILGPPLPERDRARLKAIFAPTGRKLGD